MTWEDSENQGLEWLRVLGFSEAECSYSKSGHDIKWLGKKPENQGLEWLRVPGFSEAECSYGKSGHDIKWPGKKPEN